MPIIFNFGPFGHIETNSGKDIYDSIFYNGNRMPSPNLNRLTRTGKVSIFSLRFRLGFDGLPQFVDFFVGFTGQSYLARFLLFRVGFTARATSLDFFVSCCCNRSSLYSFLYQATPVVAVRFSATPLFLIKMQ